jgi:hypothetical protein
MAHYLAGKLEAETMLAFVQHLQSYSHSTPFSNNYQKPPDAVRSPRDADLPHCGLCIFFPVVTSKVSEDRQGDACDAVAVQP